MNSRRTLVTYSTIAVALAAGCLYARTGTGTSPATDPMSAESPAAFTHPALFSYADPQPADTTDRSMLPAEKVYKNITTLKGMTAGELVSSMTFISNSLGVRCGFCHAQGDFASDEKPEKKTARSMILMTHDINAKNFGPLTVTCFTCHHGSPQPTAVPSLAQADWTRLDLAHHLKADSTTTADAVLDRYVQAIGGAAALAKVTTRVAKASELQAGGTTSTVDIYQKAPNMIRSTNVSSDPKRGTGIDIFDGTTGWFIFGNRPPGKAGESELEEIVRMAEFFPAADLRSTYSKVQLIGKEHINDRDVYVIAASRNDKTTDRLYFDAATGLLVRRYVEFRTPLGAIPFSVEYSDYREIDGVKLPYAAKWSTPRESWTDTITQLRNNIAIADTMFARPK